MLEEQTYFIHSFRGNSIFISFFYNKHKALNIHMNTRAHILRER